MKKDGESYNQHQEFTTTLILKPVNSMKKKSQMEKNNITMNI